MGRAEPEAGCRSIRPTPRRRLRLRRRPRCRPRLPSEADTSDTYDTCTHTHTCAHTRTRAHEAVPDQATAGGSRQPNVKLSTTSGGSHPATLTKGNSTHVCPLVMRFSLGVYVPC